MGVSDVQSWLKGARMAQSIHRDNLGDTTSNGGIVAREGLSAATLRAAPQLEKLLAAERSQQMAARPAPYMAPPSLGPGTQMPMRGPGIGNVPKPPGSTSDSGE
jgi:hypothetical protein